MRIALLLLFLSIPCHAKEIMIFGSPHLSQQSVPPQQLSSIIERLVEFNPDKVVVEWLHPSIPESETWNYRAIKNEHGDTWLQESCQSSNHIAIGQCYFANGDEVNAAYHWFLAETKGVDVSQLKTLTRDNFANHELGLIGFKVAKLLNQQSLTSFDWQAQQDMYRVGWERIIFKALNELADSEQEMQKYVMPLVNAIKQNDTSLIEQHSNTGYLKQLKAFIDENKRLELARSALESDDLLANILNMQSKTFLKLEQDYYYKLLPMLGEEGKQLRVDYEYRNQKMFDFIDQDANRILVVVGAGHRLFLENIARKKGYKVVTLL